MIITENQFTNTYDKLSNLEQLRESGTGKYWAIQHDPEFFDYEAYYSEYDAEQDMAWFGGNRNFCEINADLRKKMATTLEEIAYDLDNLDPDDDIDAAKYEIVDYYFKIDGFQHMPSLLIQKVAKLADDFYGCGSRDEENEIIAETLSIQHKQKFVTGTIKGYSQSDWLDYIMPKKVADKSLKYIESVLFATGTEFMITEDRYETEPDWADVNTFTAYTDEWSDNGLVMFVADQCGVFPEDVVVKVIDGSDYRVL